MRDVYTWHVEYVDGEILTEADAEALGGAWDHVDNDRVRAIILMPVQSDRQPVIARLPDGATPIFFRRRTRTLETQEEQESITCLGWKTDHAASYLWVWDGGKVAMTHCDLYDLT